MMVRYLQGGWGLIAGAGLLALALCVLVNPAPAQAACSNPYGEAGDMVYNTTHSVAQFCDDTDWIGMGGGGSSLWLDDGPGGPAEIYYNGGNVGIGTNDPQQKLDVVGTVGAAHLSIDGFSGRSLGFNVFWNGSAWEYVESDYGGIWRASSADGKMQYWTLPSGTGGATGSPTPRFTIDNGGNVGVGDDTPDTGLKLDVEGKVGATEYCDQNGANCTAAASLGGSSSLWLNDGAGGPAEIYYNGGNVGIGTNDPSSKLSINAGTGNDATAEITITSGANDYLNFYSDLGAGSYNSITQAGDKGIFFSNGAQDTGTLVIAPWASTSAKGIRITSTGTVGIGDTSPDTGLTLDVEGKVGATEYCDQNGANCTPAASLACTETCAYKTGNRTSRITVTTDMAMYSGTGPELVDGVISNGFRPTSGQAVAGKVINFDFGTSTKVTEATYRKGGSNTHGVWKWQGSANSSSWTDIGTSFTLGSSSPQIISQLSGNTTAYRYYRLLGVSGNYIETLGSDAFEMDFEECSCTTGGSGDPIFISCTNEQSDGDTTGDVAACVEAASNGGEGTSNYRVLNCIGLSGTTGVGAGLVNWNGSKWTVYTGSWKDCTDGSTVVMDLNAGG